MIKILKAYKTMRLALPLGKRVVLLTLCGFTIVSHAQVIVFDNTNGYTSQSSAAAPGDIYGQTFIMPDTNGYFSSLTLSLASGSSGTAEVDLYTYSVSFGMIFNSVLGTVDGSGSVNLSSNPTLLANAMYAVVLDSPSSGTFTWNATDDAPAVGVAGFSPGGSVYSADPTGDTGWNVFLSQSLQIQASVAAAAPAIAPEISITSMFFGLGALFIVMDYILRRKIRLLPQS